MASKKSAKPNILYIMSDDIGWFNISCNNNGIMGYRTPNIVRIAKEGANFTDFYGQQSCTAGRAAFITGQSPIRTGPDQSRHARLALGPQSRRPDGCRSFSRTSVTPPVSSARTILATATISIPTMHGFDEFFGNLYHLQCRGRTGIPGLSEGPQLPQEIRSARRSEVQGDGQGRRNGRSVFGKVGKQTIENTGPPDAQAHGNGGRGIPWLRARLHGPQDQGRRTLVLLFQYDAHARLHASQAEIRRQDRPRCFIPTAWWNSMAISGNCSTSWKSSASPTTPSSSSDRQRRGGDVLARRRRDAVPRRERHQLGRRLARALRHALARRHRTWPRDQRRLLAAGLHPDVSPRPRAKPISLPR